MTDRTRRFSFLFAGQRRRITTNLLPVAAFAQRFLGRFDFRKEAEEMPPADLICMQLGHGEIRLRAPDLELQQVVHADDILPAFDLNLRECMRRWLAPELALHAAVLGVSGGALLVAGASGAGKSTLAVAWWAAGYPVYSDEFALFDATVAEHPVLQSVPRPWEITHDREDPLLRKAMVELEWCGYPLRTHDGSLLHAAYLIPPAPLPPPAPLVGVVFPVTCDQFTEPGRVDRPEVLLEAWLGSIDRDKIAKIRPWLLNVPAIVLPRQQPSEMVRILHAMFTLDSLTSVV